MRMDGGRGISRRRFLKGGAGLAGAAFLVWHPTKYAELLAERDGALVVTAPTNGAARRAWATGA